MIKLTHIQQKKYKPIRVGDTVEIIKYRNVPEKSRYIGNRVCVKKIKKKVHFNPETIYILDCYNNPYFWYREELKLLKCD